MKTTRRRNQEEKDRHIHKLLMKRKDLTPSILSLPTELITECLARLANSSFVDAFSARLSCKRLYQMTHDRYVLKQICLENFPVIPWTAAEQSMFLERCIKSGHPEALYRQGVIEYFSHVRLEDGIECLNRAAKAEHLGACYILGVILLCQGEPSADEGKKLLTYVRSNKGIRESRKKLKHIIRIIWLRKDLKPKSIDCPSQGKHKRRNRWPEDSDDEDDFGCEICACHLQVAFVCKLLHPVFLKQNRSLNR